MFLNIIMLFTVYVVLLIMYFAMRHMVFDDGIYLFGARKNSMMYDTEKNRDFIEGVKKKYIKDLNRITLLIAVGSLLPIAIPFVSIKTMIWTFMIFAIIVLVSIPQANCFKKIVNWKKENGFIDENDDDEYWKWGMIYNNPSDSHSMVEKRVGMGITFNMAKPVGKIVNLILIITLIGTIGLFLWISLEEFLPIHLVVEDEYVKVKQIGVEYKVKIKDIDDADLLERTPRMSRSSGTSVDNLNKGDFYVPEEHQGCKVMFNPQNKLIIRIKTEDEIYYFGGFDDKETREVYYSFREGNIKSK